MGIETSKLKLLKPEENEFYNEFTQQAENWDKVDEAVSNDTGAEIGYNGIKYIQDTGEKVAGKVYYDKLQNGLWYCKVATSETNNSDKFENYSNYSNGNRIAELRASTAYTTVASIQVLNGSLEIRKATVGNVVYFTGYCLTSGGKFETTTVNYNPVNEKYRLLGSVGFAESGDDLSFTVSTDGTKVSLTLRRVGDGQPDSVKRTILAVCEKF